VNRRAFQPLPVGLALALMGAGVEGVGSLAFQCLAPSRPSSQGEITRSNYALTYHAGAAG
jgi:hypothetical protein